MDPIKKNLSYKFMEKLTKSKYSSNPLVSGVSKATMNSLKALHNTFGSDSDSELIKEEINKNEQFVRKIKSIIKITIDKYKENCEFSTNENEYNMIVILLDSILRHTSNDQDSYKQLLKYVTEISKLACGITAKEKEYLIEKYTKLLKMEMYSQGEFLKEIFNEIKIRQGTPESDNSDFTSESDSVNSNRSSINTIIPPRKNSDTYNLLNYSNSSSLDKINNLFGTNSN